MRKTGRQIVYQSIRSIIANAESNRSWAIPFDGVIESVNCSGWLRTGATDTGDVDGKIVYGLRQDIEQTLDDLTTFTDIFAAFQIATHAETAAGYQVAFLNHQIQVFVPVRVGQIIRGYYSVGSIGTMDTIVTLRLVGDR